MIGFEKLKAACAAVGITEVEVYRVLKEMVEICTAMGDTEDAKHYEDAAANIYKAYNKEFYNKETGVYETKQWNGSVSRTKYRQACNLLTLELGLCPDEYHDLVLQNLLDDIAKKGNHADVGHIGAELILPLLSREGHSDLAMTILLQKDHPSWGYWLTKGATTCWEGWHENTIRSICHFFLGSYDEWFYQNLAGIRDPRDGYTKKRQSRATKSTVTDFRAYGLFAVRKRYIKNLKIKFQAF